MKDVSEWVPAGDTRIFMSAYIRHEVLADMKLKHVTDKRNRPQATSIRPDFFFKKMSRITLWDFADSSKPVMESDNWDLTFFLNIEISN